MKDEILKLRNEGKTYNEIQKTLNCSKGTISYYCGKNQKEKTVIRTRKRRENKLVRKLDAFKYRKSRNVRESVRRFNKRDNEIKGRIDKNIDKTFTVDDVINKFGTSTFCYISGESINLYNDDFNLDHIHPSSRGGNNSLENLGITHPIVNTMKGELTPDELIEWCTKILNFNGYNITTR